MNRTLQEYERESSQRLAGRLHELAERYPAALARVGVGQGTIADPHLKAVVEAVARLVAEARLHFDTRWSAVLAQALEHVAPHLGAPVPPLAMVEFEPSADAPRGAKAPRGALLRPSPNGAVDARLHECVLRTCYTLRVVPWRVKRVEYLAERPPQDRSLALPAPARAWLGLELAPALAGLRTNSLRRVRLHFSSADEHLSFGLLQAWLRDAVAVVARFGKGPWQKVRWRPVGLGPKHLLLPPGRMLAARQHLFETFLFPRKHLFIDLLDLHQGRDAEKAAACEIAVLFGREQPDLVRLSKRDIRLNCTPVVNLFPATAQPLKPGVTETEHAVEMPSRFGQREVQSVDRVVESSPQTPAGQVCPEQFSGCYAGDANSARYAWHATRHGDSAARGLSLALLDRDLAADRAAGSHVLHVETTCSNGDLACELPPDTELACGEGPAQGLTARLLTRPTGTLVPPQAEQAAGRLHVHLAEPRRWDALGRYSLPAIRQRLALLSPAGFTPRDDAQGGAAPDYAARLIGAITAVEPLPADRPRRLTITLDAGQVPGGATEWLARVLRAYLSEDALLGHRLQVVIRDAEGEIAHDSP